MKALIHTALLSLVFGTALSAQDFVQVEQGKDYVKTVFLNLKTQETTTIDDTDWEIGFSTDPADYAIHINEAASNAADSKSVYLFSTTATDFSSVDLSQARDTLYNNEDDWSEGAFNVVRDTSDNNDKGWGEYDPETDITTGSRIFIVELRNGDHKKLRIDQSDQGAYTFTYADLNGSNEVTETIDVTDYAGKVLVYYSIRDQKVLDLEPEAWDLKFTRYNTLVQGGEDEVAYHYVTGVLLHPDAEVAVASDIDPESVQFSDFEDQLTDQAAAIGHEWKYLDFATFQYSIVENQVFFVKTAENEVYKVQFIDFEGASTGVTTLIFNLEEVLSATAQLPDYIEKTKLYPNPLTAGSALYLEIDSKELKPRSIVRIYDTQGREIYREHTRLLTGNNVLTIPVNALPGMYFLTVGDGTELITLPFLKQ